MAMNFVKLPSKFKMLFRPRRRYFRHAELCDRQGSRGRRRRHRGAQGPYRSGTRSDRQLANDPKNKETPPGSGASVVIGSAPYVFNRQL